jgi:inositol phosphorylceramide mannosyltransferase catalytic subunit
MDPRNPIGDAQATAHVDRVNPVSRLHSGLHADGLRIPPRIIQTARNRDLPLLAKAASANLRCLNAGFEYLFFDDREVAQFVAREFPQYGAVFESFPFPIQRYDFFRYLAVFRHGGFYFDLDVFLASDLDELLPLGCVFPFERLSLSRYLRSRYDFDWEIGNYAFGAAPRHPFLAAVIENCVRAQKDPSWVAPMMREVPSLFRRDFYVLNTTGPRLVTRTLAENPGLAGSVTVLSPGDVNDPHNWYHFGHFGVHLMDGSWRSRGSVVRRLERMWEAVALRRLTVARRNTRKGKPSWVADVT